MIKDPLLHQSAHIPALYAFLLQAGCSYAQGYFYSRPLPIPQFEALAFGTKRPFPVAPSIKAIAETLEQSSK